MNIAEFITARLAEDEAAAEAAEGTCHFDGSSEDADHYERHDPARVLREITAKRAILADHQIKPAAYPDPEDKDFGCQRCYFDSDEGVYGFGYCPTLLALAAIHSDHQDYQEEWRP